MSRIKAAAFIEHCRKSPECLADLPRYADFSMLAQKARTLGYLFDETELAGAYAAEWILRETGSAQPGSAPAEC